MNLKKIFQRVILLDLTIMILIIISVFYQSDTVLAFNESMNPSNELNDMLGIIALISFIIYFINLYFLYKFKNPGKQIYLFLFNWNYNFTFVRNKCIWPSYVYN